MRSHVTGPYLWFPVEKEKPEVKLHFYLDGQKFQEIDIQLGGAEKDLYTCMYVGDYMGRELEIRSDAPKELLRGISFHADKVQDAYPFRPQLHFSPEIGWHNDPNGLVYADGLYHLYYQWNPYGVLWGNMHWGHAVSRDLFTWEHRPMAIAPDVYGTAYSGCAWIDKDDRTGYGKNALLFYYTAAGGRNAWSKEAGHLFTQRLKVSTDGGDTLTRSDQFLIGHVAGENRDPKIFYHKESSAYIMLLYLDGYEFAIYRSEDLLNWQETCRLSIKGMRECPDLFCLLVENGDGEEKKWVFWSADGYYVIGDFDGYTFTQESPVQMAYGTKLPYAAQSYAGVEDRVISVAWLRMENDWGDYRGLMSIPAEVSLVRDGEGYKVRLQPVRELAALRQERKELEKGCKHTGIGLGGVPLEADLAWDLLEKGQTKLHLGNYDIIVDHAEKVIRFYELEKHLDMAAVPFSRKDGLTLKLIVDQEVVEFYGNDGMIYGAVEMKENILQETLTMDSDVELRSMSWCRLVR